ncbi:Starch-binding associating with outer membrane [Nonlabens sp. Hel1_33_55]|uniref:RagB/SusD family nutrient uptake outer membrane protein n=1 Tax=Nonlabens sp. Hel1_33_55 TaxID=1336802 RepID=UPI000875BEFC|nr:RagB/SusD family nutrient uptake outer membrane protein [Nonlabens sp. Hel1_33_55]SCX99601.1 Starch-binding associating with outer membrane [Nonlabens sp. Hel1_33_55]
MKSIIKLFGLTLLLLGITGCEDSLEEEPDTLFRQEQIFATEQGLEAAVNGLYQSMADGDYHGSSVHGLLMPVSGKFYSSQGASSDASSLNTLPNNTWIERIWPQMYRTINVANEIIAQLELGSELANRDVALGQAYFVRAATYFDLVRLFGSVPLKVEPSTSETLNAPRAPKSDVYNLIISDFEQAKILLPALGSQTIGRPAKPAAFAYLGKVYMQLAGEDGGDPTLWQNAFDETIEVYQKYSLAPTHAILFEDLEQNSVESIFEIQYGQNGAVRNSDVIRFYTPNGYFENFDTFGRVRPNKEVYTQHVTQYPDDPRLESTFIAGSYQRYNSNRMEFQERTIYPNRTNGNDGFPVLKKYIDPDFNGATTSRNFLKFRYADVLLMLAEIENELNGPDNAYQYVNEVLDRARNSSSPAATEPADFAAFTQDEFRTRILRERQYEMLGEGHIWFDTRRRGYDYFLEEVVQTHNNFDNLGNQDFIYPTDRKNMLLPIASSEINGNQLIDQSDQNPGY